MKSFAIYYLDNKEHNDSSASIPDTQRAAAELHVNIWKVYQGKLRLKPKYYFDIGLKIDCKYRDLMIYIPFQIAKSDDYDLGRIIGENAELLCAIFNDEMLASQEQNKCFYKIKYSAENNDDSTFYIYQLGPNNIEVTTSGEKQPKGTYLHISIKGTPDNKAEDCSRSVYIRFRVESVDCSEVVVKEDLSNDLIQNAFSSIDLFDIRFNEIREIGKKIQEEMRYKKYIPLLFNKVHLFYISDTKENINNESLLNIDSRLLENEPWRNYIPRTDLKGTHFVAHHWRKKIENNKTFKDFTIYFSTKYPNINWQRLTIYIGVAILLGWVGSMLTFKFENIIFDKDHCRDIIRMFVVLSILLIIIVIIIIRNLGVVPLSLYRNRKR